MDAGSYSIGKLLKIVTLLVVLSLPVISQKAENDEKPLYDEVVQAEYLPPPTKGTKEFKFLQNFSLRVEVILQTVNDNEFDAATTYLEKPGDMFSGPVVFPMGSVILGMFAGKRTALIQTKVGEFVGDFVEKAIESFPNALFVIGVGVCYSFDRSKYKLGDVIVSERISNLANYKWDKEGRVENRGDTVSVVHDLLRIFCLNLKHKPPFKVSTNNRYSNVYSGNIISHPHLIDNREIRDKLHEEIRTAIGGEMEGGELMKFVRKGKIKGIIVIKGVCNYADGEKAKNWQYTAALAALSYTKSKLEFEPDFLDEESFQKAPSDSTPSSSSKPTDTPKKDSHNDNLVFKIMSALDAAQTGEEGKIIEAGRIIRYKAKWRVHDFNDPVVWDATAQDEETGIKAEVHHQDSDAIANRLAVKKLCEKLKLEGVLHDEL